MISTSPLIRTLALSLTAAAMVTAAASTASAQRDKGDIQRVIRANMNEARACYTHLLKKHPDLEAKVKVRFTIAADGGVEDASVASTGDAVKDALGACLVQKVSALKFGTARDGEATKVTYPFVFKTK